MDVIPSNIVIVYTEFRMGFFVVVVVVTGFVFSGWALLSVPFEFRCSPLAHNYCLSILSQNTNLVFIIFNNRIATT